ncbi:MAG TPA: hypothetical protein VFP55_07025 [Solirubrobacteraceae bacterium]|nr:hypothetical protein [Solirubrobacteraceae bacterium]
MSGTGPAAQTASATGLRLLAHHDLGGYGDGMQLLREQDALYVGHAGTTGMGTSILDVSDPDKPVLVDQWPAPENTHTHKVQVADGLLLINHEQFPFGSQTAVPFSGGLAIYSLADPLAPQRLCFWESGGLGVHRIVWLGGRYAHMSLTPDGFSDRIWLVLDLSDPEHPAEVARWCWPGQDTGEPAQQPEGERYAAHHALTESGRAYLGYGDAGMVVLDVSDMRNPVQVAHLSWGGGSTHTCLPLPGRELVVATDEQVVNGPGAPERTIRVIDVSGERPYVRSLVPRPAGSFDRLPLRFGSHNLHENRPGSYRSASIVFATYFSAGLRVYDLTDPDSPVELAHWVPEPPAGQPAPQLNDLFVDRDGLIWVTDRLRGGLYVLQAESALAERMAAARLPAGA